MQTFLPFPTNTELVSHPAYVWNQGRDVHLLEPMCDAMFRCVMLCFAYKMAYIPSSSKQNPELYQPFFKQAVIIRQTQNETHLYINSSKHDTQDIHSLHSACFDGVGVSASGVPSSIPPNSNFQIMFTLPVKSTWGGEATKAASELNSIRNSDRQFAGYQ